MDTLWTPHRFAGGWLALDVANTVVMRADAVRRVDRFDDAAEVARFARAASGFRAGETGIGSLTVDDPQRVRPAVIALREAIDTLFRAEAGAGTASAGQLAGMLSVCAQALDGVRLPLARHGYCFASADAAPFVPAVALSALALLEPGRRTRTRICDNCGWLFLDRSRNGSRRWCDMTVCGNRTKARRHYARRRHREDGHG